MSVFIQYKINRRAAKNIQTKTINVVQSYTRPRMKYHFSTIIKKETLFTMKRLVIQSANLLSLKIEGCCQSSGKKPKPESPISQFHTIYFVTIRKTIT